MNKKLRMGVVGAGVFGHEEQQDVAGLHFGFADLAGDLLALTGDAHQHGLLAPRQANAGRGFARTGS